MQKNVNGQTQHEYHLKDHLGSTDIITDQNGNEISRMAFDPFGKRLTEHLGSSVLSQSAANDSSYHGYTGHGQLDHLGLVHMGGRVYDPDSGRFLSADVFVQSPYNTQSYNRYSYVFNNPLRFIDPSGYRSTSTEDTARKAPPQDDVVTRGSKPPPTGLTGQGLANFLNGFNFYNSSSYFSAGAGFNAAFTFGYGMGLASQDALNNAVNGDVNSAMYFARIQSKVMKSGKVNGKGLSLDAQEELDSDVGKLRTKFNEVVADMDARGLRRPGAGKLNGQINNVKGFWQKALGGEVCYKGCTEQTLHLYEQLVDSGFVESLSLDWSVQFRYRETGSDLTNLGPHNWLEAFPNNSIYEGNVRLDTWLNEFDSTVKVK